MPDQPDSQERVLWELVPLAEAAMDDAALNQRVYLAVEKELGRIVQEHYPGMKNWQPEQLRKLADRISRHACDFCIEVSNLNYAASQSEG